MTTVLWVPRPPQAQGLSGELKGLRGPVLAAVTQPQDTKHFLRRQVCGAALGTRPPDSSATSLERSGRCQALSLRKLLRGPAHRLCGVVKWAPSAWPPKARLKKAASLAAAPLACSSRAWDLPAEHLAGCRELLRGWSSPRATGEGVSQMEC